MTNKTFKLPDLGEGLTEADLSAWMVAVGDRIELNQIIAEVETAKAAVELPSPYAGTVVELLAEEGQTVDVGAPIIVVGIEGPEADADDAPEGDTLLEAAAPATPEDAASEKKVPVLVGYGVAGESPSRRRLRSAEPRGRAATGATKPVTTEPVLDEPTVQRPPAKPPVRKLARDHGVDLADLTGTGPGGRITREDVLAGRDATAGTATVLSDASTSTVTPTSLDATVSVSDSPESSARETRVPIRGVRKHTAQAMVRSAFTAPHVTEFITVDITETMDLLARLKASKTFSTIKLTPLALISKALLIALRDNPSLNSQWDEEAQEIVTKHYVNLGIAAATPRGLMVPNIKNADRLGLRDLAVALSELTTTARDGKTTPTDLAKGTITVTNVGVFGVDTGTPILNPGEAAILCLGAIRKQPWIVDDQITIRSITTLSLSFDHRLVDGQQGSQLLADLASILQDPLNLVALA
ncbi:dihydrolipoamide acetyltransferase family protein [Rhodococcus sp. UNC23MFCrub1.1]|uniref:dihydrolipoamide acetyltransferase family protein n=1 Tax=Rhodococcus sp. UNC23MFCrub1.1 TaxID=1449068 RepID=UPI000484F3F1|nr:dihydrolipoamide acetyltransferase family protein [Rhodococcus sp. UNC23MFCrub1.1]